MEPGKRRVAGSVELPPDEGRTVLKCCEAAGIQPARELMDRPDSCQHFHCCLHGTAGDCANFRQIVHGAQNCRRFGVRRNHRWSLWLRGRMSLTARYLSRSLNNIIGDGVLL